MKLNPFNEREQKRFYYSFGGNNGGRVYPWVYYQLGVNNQQYVVYNGFQISDPLFKINDAQYCSNPYPQIVFMYPVEYNVFGVDGKTDLTWTLDNTGNYKKDFQIFDHLGNLMVRARDNGINPALILSRNQYAPFGKKMNIEPAIPPNIAFGYQNRLGYISKEQDRESRLADHGVRKYDYDLGRFTSTDALWEKYPGWSPYQYSANNPINMLDGNGKFTIPKAGSTMPENLGTNGNYYKDYPVLIAIANNALEYIQKDDNRILKILVAETGASESKIKYDFTSGSGPNLWVKDRLASGSEGLHHKGNLFVLPGPLVDANNSGDTKTEREGSATASFLTIIHEYLHEYNLTEKEIAKIEKKIMPGVIGALSAQKEIENGNLKPIIEVPPEKK